ncbi:SixA phosphatase family protein [Nocardioides daeguensis]|uniref:SixA phosphatase family protein n=1 Tax=Nocardioides daeguensis TaxID=908359 RepID=UPI001C4975A3|nr:histidine phosphatase family protein [Nocardioides daeguensis]MBV6726675.1 histidine phosphatase family protein [Nocardioides daeguensis]MCR1774573.1 histidine phosphatase family protein [Nocardioides daeguensis]
MEKQRLLVVVRHAKAEQFAASDVERVLSPRGRDDGRALGRWLADEGITPDVAYVSYAARTRETWDVVAAGAGWGLAPQIDGNLYGTDEEGVLELVRSTPEHASSVVVVGHNPTMAMLVQLLDDGEGEASGSVELGSFPTSAAAVFEVAGAWDDVAPMGGRLRACHVGRAADQG